MTDQLSPSTDRPAPPPGNARPTPLETYAVLGGVLAQACDLETWQPAMFTQAVIGWDGHVSLALSDERTATDLAGRLGLERTRRSTQRPTPRYEGHDTRVLDHVVVWSGTQAGHPVELTARWHSPLGELDVPEGEILA